MKGMKENYFLAKWLANEISEAELKKHISEEDLRAYKKIVSTTNTFETPEFYAHENLAKLDLSKSKTKVRKLNFTKYIYRVAAVFAIIFATYYFVENRTQQYNTTIAEKINFELPDNSSVDLNADSKIAFNPVNWKKNRNLSLSGEAYFKVAKGAKFTVNTTMGNVTVLGTQFNVIARSNYFEVVCYEGLVSVTYKNNTIKIPAGSSFKVLNSEIKFNKFVSETAPLWIQNISSFKSMPYWYVINELERQYNISITYNQKYSDSLFTGNFEHSNLENALKAITIPLNLNYTFVSDTEVSLE